MDNGDWMGPQRLTNPPRPHFTEPLMSAEKGLAQGDTEYFLAELELKGDRQSCWWELGGGGQKRAPHGQVFFSVLSGKGMRGSMGWEGKEEALLFLRLVHWVAEKRQRQGAAEKSRRAAKQEGSGRREHCRTRVRSRREELQWRSDTCTSSLETANSLLSWWEQKSDQGRTRSVLKINNQWPGQSLWSSSRAQGTRRTLDAAGLCQHPEGRSSKPWAAEGHPHREAKGTKGFQEGGR